MLLIPMGLTYTFGRLAGDTRQGWAVFAAMAILLIPLVGLGCSQRAAGQSPGRQAGS